MEWKKNELEEAQSAFFKEAHSRTKALKHIDIAHKNHSVWKENATAVQQSWSFLYKHLTDEIAELAPALQTLRLRDLSQLWQRSCC